MEKIKLEEIIDCKSTWAKYVYLSFPHALGIKLTKEQRCANISWHF